MLPAAYRAFGRHCTSRGRRCARLLAIVLANSLVFVRRRLWLAARIRETEDYSKNALSGQTLAPREAVFPRS